MTKTTRMVFLLGAVLATLLLMGVSDASAIWYNDANDPCPTYEDCTMQNGGTSPTPVNCTASASQNQRCRTCLPNYDQYGNQTGTTCARTPFSGGCKCDFFNGDCLLTGRCTYVEW